MSAPDLQTTVLLTGLMSLVHALVLALIYRISPRYPGVDRWSLGSTVMASGCTSLALFGLPSSPLMSLVVALLMLAGTAILHDGLARFLDAAPACRRRALTLVALPTVVLLLLFAPADHSLFAHTATGALGVGLLLGHCAWLLFRRPPPYLGLAAQFTSLAMGAFAVLLVGWVMWAGVSGGTTGTSLLAAWTSGFLALLVGGSLWTAGLSAMLVQRILFELRESEAEYRTLALESTRLHEAAELRAVEIERLATVDPLTELSNRRHFFARAEQELTRARCSLAPAAVILLDVDHFKRVNDTYGHQAGDVVLRGVAATCRASLRGTDLIGRYGGEEIAILLPGTNPSDAERVAERVRASIAGMQMVVGEHRIGVTVSMGVALAAQAHEYAVDALLARADEALYHAKQSGRNQVVVNATAALLEASPAEQHQGIGF
jgi:diguanylate cyclase (GGDEF)-like protein